MKKIPYCSIVILNYFGEKVIESNIKSVLELDYPKDKYEIIIVDNDSKDRSREILKKISHKHQNIKLVFLDKNLGFSKGNNVGLRQATGEYVLLLNNDCIVERNWLKELVKTAQKDEKIFAVTSKILLFPKYLNLKLDIKLSLVPLFAWISKSSFYKYQEKSKKIYLSLWKKQSDYQLEVLFDPEKDMEVELSFLLNTRNKILTDKNKVGDLVQFHDEAVVTTDIEIKREEIEFKFKIDLTDKKIKRIALDKIQNAGIMIFQNGYCRDIGTIIRYNQQYYEYDRGQFDNEREVYGACGAAVLYRKKILDKIGLLDETFFMYYEDVEICERARFNGYKVYYSPKAIARHLHALSSGEWSPFFVYQTEKSRLLHVIYNFPLRIFFYEYYKMVFRLFINILKLRAKIMYILRNVNDKKTGNDDFEIQRKISQVKVLIYFFFSLPYLLILRIKKNLGVKEGAFKKNYQDIINGRWYFE